MTLNQQVIVDEIGGACVIGQNAADFRRGEVNLVHPLFAKEALHSRLIAQIQLRPGSRHQFYVTSRA